MTNANAKKKILIVEDEADVREVLSRTLRSAGYEVMEASHALGAICAMVRSGADLILTDIRMPVVDGLDLVRELKSHDDTRHIPIMAVSGMVTPESRTAALEAGCVGFIAKPIDTAVFLKQIAQVLGADEDVVCLAN
jgi:two-component system cell cycle response regulator DivK